MDRHYTLMFMSRRNAARSLIAEAVVNRHGNGHFRACSAAVEPAPAAHPAVLDVLGRAGYGTEGLHPKHWRQFHAADGPRLDFVFALTNTDNPDEFPDWPGRPAASLWCYPDPVAIVGGEWEQRRAVAKTLSALERQMRVFMQLSFASLDHIALHKRLDEIRATDAAHPS